MTTATQDELKQLAELMHSKFCHYNHTDQCGWMYEYELEVVVDPKYGKVSQTRRDADGNTIANWRAHERKKYLNKAALLTEKLEPDVPVGVIYMVLEAL